MGIENAVKRLKVNLFATPFDTLLTALVVPTLFWGIWTFCAWLLAVAQWHVIGQSAKVLMVGVFPAAELWRVWVAAFLFAVAMGLLVSSIIPMRGLRAASTVIGILAVTALALQVSWSAGINTFLVGSSLECAWLLGQTLPRVRKLAGGLSLGALGLALYLLVPAGPATWGGFLLSVLLTAISAALTIPIGAALAFGRQSKIGSIRILCTAYIEFMRAVPLILVVYFIWIAFPLLLPSVPVPDVLRGLIGFVIFYSAFAAEYIRSGLQAVPRGQVEASEALGLSSWDIKIRIVGPQAMRVALPGMVGNVLDIFNYAPLVFIIGLADFLRVGQMILADPQNSDKVYEVYTFLFIVCFLVGSAVTYFARHLEAHLSKGISNEGR
ncbi:MULTISPECIES: amino acid ABC transporter permease [unclassified Mesorhizobium]|uniref:amino acid ABC transporter permease n=1 Tax=unclassified Mesorhizobium TaxID=325217 RepID=UPI0024156EAB|nr:MULTISPECIES: amino acid ABC transporter permease [unclassified Mesorhizobium]MDG4889897.1 amino acid ABC transporter permease [Mesorhizobium sp. WSM4887]MDG4904040.1 amino acid ABC transporter permease [Mesorhizobium sp. WSM4962]MDG4909067.1 amino acid ABC transporter permease [Mesorhizobium sp. WSM4898]MDG4921691.1 amino acid ABC transporter permease [Mesorhizobium sp. WSM4989]